MKNRFLFLISLVCIALISGCDSLALVEKKSIHAGGETFTGSQEASEETVESLEEENKGTLLESGPAYDFALGLLNNDPALIYPNIYSAFPAYPEEESFKEFAKAKIDRFFLWDVYVPEKDDLRVIAHDGYISIEVDSEEMGAIHDRYDLDFPMKDGKVVFDELVIRQAELALPASIPFTINGTAVDLPAEREGNMDIYRLKKLLGGAYTVQFDDSYLNLTDFSFFVMDDPVGRQTYVDYYGSSDYFLKKDLEEELYRVAENFFSQVMDQIADNSKDTNRIDNVSSTLNNQAKLKLMKDIEREIDSLKHYDDPKFLSFEEPDDGFQLNPVDTKNFRISLEVQFRIERKILQLPKNVELTVELGFHYNQGQLVISSVSVQEGIRDLTRKDIK